MNERTKSYGTGKKCVPEILTKWSWQLLSCTKTYIGTEQQADHIAEQTVNHPG